MKIKNSGIIILLLAAILATLVYNSCRHQQAVPVAPPTPVKEPATPAATITELTAEARVVTYLKQHHKLPEYYMTKSEARQHGWVPAQQNLCDVLPGRAIGGDVFTNREKQLPYQRGRVWYEADINYRCGGRNADRVLFSGDGLVYTTHDHYQTFQQQ